MHCIAINLDAAADRRAALERNVRECLPSSWRLERFAAIDALQASAHPGRLRDAEKGCYLSHVAVIEQAMAIDDHVLVLEDDVLFGPHSASGIDAAIGSLPVEAWDVIFTDVCIANVHAMIELLEIRRRLVAASQATLLELARLPFAGATAYVVNRAAKARVLDTVRAGARSLDQPYDLFLRDRITAGALRAKVIFPFATSLSEHAGASSIQLGGEFGLTDFVWDAYRRLVFADRDLPALQRAVRAGPDSALDAETEIIGRLVGLQLSPGYKVR